MDAGFELVQVFETGFEFVEGFDDAGEPLIVLLAVDAGLHPTIEGPHGKDEDPKLHGTSGRGLQAMLSIGRVYRGLGGERWIRRGGVAEWLRRVELKAPAAEGGRYKDEGLPGNRIARLGWRWRLDRSRGPLTKAMHLRERHTKPFLRRRSCGGSGLFLR